MEEKRKLITELIYTFSRLAGINDEKIINELIEKLCKIDINDTIDYILVSLDDKINEGTLTKEQVFSNIQPLLNLNPNKYKNINDLIERLNWIKEMNIAHPETPLKENHEIVLKTFDEFNKLTMGKFDSFYTGGLMGYIATGKELERYHGDLDLFINEEQLLELKKLVESSSVFTFNDNMDRKEENGHEYKVTYNGTKMSIGLFLFTRDNDQSITINEYYYPNQNTSEELLVNKTKFTKEYTELCFDNQIRIRNGLPYKMMSIESIYNSKKDGRPKDKYDAKIIETHIDKEKESKIEHLKTGITKINNRPATNSIPYALEEQKKNNKLSTESNNQVISKPKTLTLKPNNQINNKGIISSIFITFLISILTIIATVLIIK